MKENGAWLFENNHFGEWPNNGINTGRVLPCGFTARQSPAGYAYVKVSHSAIFQN